MTHPTKPTGSLIELKNDTIEINLTTKKLFDRLLLQEPIQLGQRISSFEVYAFENDEWINIAEGTTVGFKRLLKTPITEAQKLRLIILNAIDKPAISNFGVYKASALEETKE